MVLKGCAGDEHPRQQLRKVADDDERRDLVTALYGEVCAYDDGDKPGPAQHGV